MENKQQQYCFETFTGCVRCGRSKCAGICTELAEFKTIHAPYAFSGFGAKLLNYAKQQQNLWAQMHFREFAQQELDSYIENIFNLHEKPLFVFPNIRIQRLWQNEWHPSQEFIHIIQTKSKLKNKSANIHWNTQLFQTQKASLSADKREQAKNQLNRQYSLIQRLKTIPLLKTQKKSLNSNDIQSSTAVFIVDDVLTTGLSSLECYHSKELRAYWHLSWHVITLFRTPRGEKKISKD